jgi:hypothetical protein
MSVIPVSRLSASDLSALGNNLRPPSRHAVVPAPRRPRPTNDKSLVGAVNRSLARVGERVERLNTAAAS